LNQNLKVLIDKQKNIIHIHANHIRDGRGNRLNLSCKLVPVVYAIEESKDLTELFIDELVGSLLAHEQRRKLKKKESLEEAFQAKVILEEKNTVCTEDTTDMRLRRSWTIWPRRVEPVGTVKPNLMRMKEKPLRSSNTRIDNYYKENSFKQRLFKMTIYVKACKNELLIIALYVDNLIFIDNSQRLINEFK
jgi:hypothetical protein